MSHIFKRSRGVAVASLALSSALVLAACGGGDNGSEGDDATYKVGVLLGLTGAYSALGDPQQRAIKLFEKELDKEGGVNGHPVDFVYLDTKSSESEAVNQLRRLATQENVIGVLGPSSSGEGIALKPIAQSLKLPTIAIASNDLIAEPVAPYMYKEFPSSIDSLKAQLAFIKDEGYTKIGLLASNNAFGQEPADALPKLAKAEGLDLVASEKFAPDSTNVTSQLSVVGRANPEVVLVAAVSPANVIVAKNAKAMDFKPLIFQGPGSASLSYLKLGGDAANGTLVQASKVLLPETEIPADDPQKDVISHYAEAWAAEYDDDPGQFDGGAWDAALMLRAGLEGIEGNPKSIADGRRLLQESLDTNVKDLPGINAVYTLSKTQHGPRGIAGLSILEVKDGKFVLRKGN